MKVWARLASCRAEDSSCCRCRLWVCSLRHFRCSVLRRWHKCRSRGRLRRVCDATVRTWSLPPVSGWLAVTSLSGVKSWLSAFEEPAGVGYELTECLNLPKQFAVIKELEWAASLAVTRSTTGVTLLEDLLAFATLLAITACFNVFNWTGLTVSAVSPDEHIATILLSLVFANLLVSGVALLDTVLDRSLELSNICFSASGLTPGGTTATSFRLQEGILAMELSANRTKHVPGSTVSLGVVHVGGVLVEVTITCDDGATLAVTSNCDNLPCGTILPEVLS